MITPLEAKWNQIYRRPSEGLPEPASVLKDYGHLLPARGVALDVACGLGGSALFLASRGLDVVAIDISPMAIEKLRESAASLKLGLETAVLDVKVFAWESNKFDVIVISRFLERALTIKIIDALRPGGLLFYQTFIRKKVTDSGPSNPNFLLSENELLRLFQPLRVLAYREEGGVGDISKGLRNEALLVAQRRITL